MEEFNLVIDVLKHELMLFLLEGGFEVSDEVDDQLDILWEEFLVFP
jgi:hypothetical protein